MQLFYWVKTHRYCLAGLYLFVFLLGFYLLQQYGPESRWVIYSAIDGWIPFNEWFVLPYFLWYVWVPLFMIYFMVQEKEAYIQLCLLMFGGATVCLLIYLIFPNGLDLRREITENNFCAELVRLLRSVDPPRNVCPSIHVSSTVAIHYVICRSQRFKRNQKVKRLSLAVTLAISLSTLLIKQHSVIDVVCGWGLSLFLRFLVYRVPADYRKLGMNVDIVNTDAVNTE